MFPNVPLYENVSPGSNMVPFMVFAARAILLALLVFPASYIVVYFDKVCLNNLSPKSFTATLGFVIFRGISYVSLSSFNISFASSIVIAKSIPSSSLWSSNGSSTIYASFASLYTVSYTHLRAHET